MGPPILTLPRAERLRLLGEIRAYFARHPLELSRHTRDAEALDLAIRTGVPQRDEDAWTSEMIRLWARRLRLAPYDTDLVVRRRSEPCACGGISGHHGRGHWPDGFLIGCWACGEEWIVLDAPRAGRLGASPEKARTPRP